MYSKRDLEKARYRASAMATEPLYAGQVLCCAHALTKAANRSAKQTMEMDFFMMYYILVLFWFL